MQSLLQYILEGIVDHPEDIDIQTTESQYGYIVLNVKVNSEDMGKVIGKNGKVINSIRKLLRVKAIKLGRRVQVELIDSQWQMD